VLELRTHLILIKYLGQVFLFKKIGLPLATRNSTIGRTYKELVMSIWKKIATLETLNQRGQGTMLSFLDIKIIEVGDDYLKATMPVDERTRQPAGILHGGASCVLAESVASIAANYAVDENHYCVGTEINASHLRPAISGLVTATGRPIRLGKTLQVWEIELHNERGQMTCISRMTAAVLRR
jgi:1,4-dihydroxy-2-naphthoyl-CoA hydrolase